MKLLAISTSVPYPGVPHAGGLFLLKHLEQLHRAHGADVTLLCPGEVTAEERRLVPEWIQLHWVSSRLPSPVERWADSVQGRMRPGSLPGGLQRALLDAQIVRLANEADLIELHWTETSVMAPMLRKARVTTPVVILEHDVGVQAEASRIAAYGSRQARLAQPVLRRVRARNERRDLDVADLVLVFKAEDRQLLEDLGVRTPVHVLEPYLDEPGPHALVRRLNQVLFTGALWRRENLEGLLWFLREVWPAVVDEIPSAALTLAGAGPPPELEAAAAETAGVVVTGAVPDLEPYYLEASLFVAPLVIRGGLKFKVLQAMRYGLPVVATEVAAEGIVTAVPEGSLWAVTGSAAEMSAAIVEALQQPERAAQVGERAAAWAAEHFSFSRSTAAVAARYRQLTEPGHP